MFCIDVAERKIKQKEYISRKTEVAHTINISYFRPLQSLSSGKYLK